MSLVKRAEIRQKNASLKRKIRLTEKSQNEQKARQKYKKRTSAQKHNNEQDRKVLLCIREEMAISEYEKIRMRNIQERLDAMLKSELRSEKEIEDLRKKYYINL